MDVSEKEIAKIPISKTDISSFNYFKLFPDQNATHIICNEGSLEKTCPRSERQKKTTSCLNSRTSQTEVISDWDICKDIAFITARSYSTTSIDNFKQKWIIERVEVNSTKRCPKKEYSFFCNKIQKCIGDEQVCDGRIQCFPGGEDENVDLCKSRGAFQREANFKCNETHRLVSKSHKMFTLVFHDKPYSRV